MKIRNGSIELHVAADGDPSAPPILLLHGITSSSGTWEWFVPTLAERFRVLRLDFRGHGASDRAPGEYHLAGYLSDAVAVIEQVAGAPCVVVGHSLGGVTTAALIQQRPDLVVAAVMEDPPLSLPAAPSGDGTGDGDGDGADLLEGNSLLTSFQLIRRSAPQLQASGIAVDVLAGILAAAPSASGGAFGELLYADAMAAMAGALLAVDASVLDPVLSGTMRSSLDPSRALAVPSLIVCADPARPDAVADPVLARRFAEISPATEVLVFDGAGHLIHDELASRDRFREAAVDFLDRTLEPVGSRS